MNPDIYYYNPTSDLAIINGTISYMPPTRLQLFEQDLSLLPSLLLKENDFIVSNKQPSQQFLDIAGILNIPSFHTLHKYELRHINSQFNWIKPWSWSPHTHHLFKSIKEQCSIQFQESPNYAWISDHKNIFSRKTSVQLLLNLSTNTANTSIIEIPQIPKVVDNIIDLNKTIRFFNNRIVIKAPWSSSGRGIYFYDSKSKLNIDWIKGILKRQGYLIVEPLLERLSDLSFQFNLNPDDSIDFLGNCVFINDNKGHFVGSYIESIPQDLMKYVNKQWFEEAIEEISTLLKESIQNLNIHKYYTGAMGVDCILFKTNKDEIKIHPCIEINLRYTMGFYTLSIRDKIHSEATGKWYVSSLNNSTWNEIKRDASSKNPIKLADGKIREGWVPLTDDSNLFCSYAQIE